MDIKQYTKRPRVLSGVIFDGTQANAAEIIEWVRSATGMYPSTSPRTDGQFNLYVPTPAGTQLLQPGDTLLQDGITYYPITLDQLQANYDDSDS